MTRLLTFSTTFLCLLSLHAVELEVEVLSNRPSRYSPSKTKQIDKAKQELLISEIWNQLDNSMNSAFLKKVIPLRKLDKVLEQAEIEDFNNQELPLISQPMRKLILFSALKKNTHFLELLKKLQTYIGELQEPEKTQYVEKFRALFLEKVADHKRYLSSLKKEWAHRFLSLVTYDSNLNRVVAGEEAPAQHSNKSDLQLFTTLHTTYKPWINKKQDHENRELTIQFSSATLLHKDYTENDIALLNVKPTLKFKNNFIDYWLVSYEGQVLFAKQNNSNAITERSHQHGLVLGLELEDTFINYFNYKSSKMQFLWRERKRIHFEDSNENSDASESGAQFNWTLSYNSNLIWQLGAEYFIYETHNSPAADHRSHKYLTSLTYPKKFSQLKSPIVFNTGYQFQQRNFFDFLGGSQKEHWHTWRAGASTQVYKAFVSLMLDYLDKQDEISTDFLPSFEESANQTRVSLGVSFKL